MSDYSSYRLGEQGEALQLTTSEEHRQAALAMAKQAQRSVLIFSRNLDPAVFDTAELEEALAQLARRSEHTFIHILIQDSDKAIKSGHRLVNLAQRLSSKIEIRKPIEEYKHINSAFVVVDETAYIKRNVADRYDADASFSDRLTARDLTLFFKEVWQRSQQDTQLRRIHI